MSSSRIATALVACVGIAIAIAAGVGYVLHKESRKRNEQRAVVLVVGDASAQLKGALKSASPEALEKVEGGLRVARSWSNVELADATEQYLVGARTILQRRADANRLTRKAAASRAALAAHMARAARRDSTWIHTASELKKQVERDHFDLEVQLNALAGLLELLPEANKRLAPHVQASLLLEEDVRQGARQSVLEEAKRARADLDRTRSLLPR